MAAASSADLTLIQRQARWLVLRGWLPVIECGAELGEMEVDGEVLPVIDFRPVTRWTHARLEGRDWSIGDAVRLERERDAGDPVALDLLGPVPVAGRTGAPAGSG